MSSRDPSPPSEPAALMLLPLGSIEAHGPHLPADTDTIIAHHLCQLVAREYLARDEGAAVVAPPVVQTVSSYAADFPGTVSASPEDERRALLAAMEEAKSLGPARLVLVTLHFDPVHLAVVRDVARTAGVHFVDFTRHAHAQRIGGEFATGSCHAGEFETSLMLAAAPELVDASYQTLPPLEVNLAQAIRAGKRSFRELGMDRAYCGGPARATAEEADRLYRVLVAIVLDEIGNS